MALLEIIGENFRPDLTAWFDEVEAVTVYRSETSLVCTIPDASVFRTNSIYAQQQPSTSHHHQQSNNSATATSSSKISMTVMNMHQPLQVPINLVRNDGIIYNTGFNFTYTP